MKRLAQGARSFASKRVWFFFRRQQSNAFAVPTAVRTDGRIVPLTWVGNSRQFWTRDGSDAPRSPGHDGCGRAFRARGLAPEDWKLRLFWGVGMVFRWKHLVHASDCLHALRAFSFGALRVCVPVPDRISLGFLRWNWRCIACFGASLPRDFALPACFHHFSGVVHAGLSRWKAEHRGSGISPTRSA